MNLLKTVIFLALLSTTTLATTTTPGTQLAQAVQNIFANSTATLDLCILYDSTGSRIWPDMLDDFIPNIPPSFAVTRLDWVGFVWTRCDFHLIYLKAGLDAVGLNKMVHLFLEARSWNRYGMFVFVAVDDVKLLEFYCALVQTLGVTKSVLYFSGKGGDFIMQYDYFKRRSNVFRDVQAIEGIMKWDFFRDMHGFDFHALFAENKPFVFFGINYQVAGMHVKFIVDFCRHVNATLKVRVPRQEFPNQAQFSQLLLGGYISVVSGITMVPKLTELVMTGAQSGLCFMTPEQIIGSMHLHLLRPYRISLFILISIILTLLPLIALFFPKQFPRGIFNQLFYGSVIDEYKMARIERFTLFSLTVLLFLLSEAYLAKLFQFLFNYQYEPHLESIEQLHVNNYIIYCDQPFFKFHAENVFPQFKNRIQLTHIGHYFNHSDPYRAFLTHCDYVKRAVLTKENLNTTTNYLRHYVLPERIPLLTNAFTHSRLQPFSARFAEKYAALFEAGVFAHWFEWDTDEWNLKVVNSMELVKFDDLFSLWKLLATCFGISFVAFIGEILTNLFLKPNTKKKINN